MESYRNVKNINADLSSNDIMKKLSHEWKEMSKEQKKKWIDSYNDENIVSI